MNNGECPQFSALIESCKALDINPQIYLQDVLERIMAHPAKRLSELLPHIWKENQYSYPSPHLRLSTRIWGSPNGY